ncbi:MAG: hypothetical protein JKX94_01300 [Sneathiella sp.]|nr:hypothetical protein [Sneathiella sp.]
MKRSLLAVCLAAMLMGAGPVSVQAEEKGADELALEGLNKLIDALSVFIDAIPQYETPELLDNGDIIIRRKQKEEKMEKSPGIEKTAT